MLVLGLYAILDEKAQAFFNPTVAHQKAEAHRSFGDRIKDPNGNLYKHPSDFSLHYLGTFDPFSGQVEPANKIELVCRGSDFSDTQK